MLIWIGSNNFARRWTRSDVLIARLEKISRDCPFIGR
jgi:hypothetical protein